MNAPIPPQDKPLQWNPARQPPPPEGNGTVTIILEGLFSMCYLDRTADQSQAQIGVHNHDAKHILEIRMNGGSCTGAAFQYTHAQVKQLERESFRIGIVGANADVSFYQRDEVFNRGTSTALDDFRWLIDVEKPDLYDLETNAKQPHYGPKILVKNGVFFTTHLAQDQSGARFQFDFVERPPGSEVRQLGAVARQTAARISLAAGQVLRFDFIDPNGTPQTCTFPAGQAAATIQISNLCFEQTGARCQHADYHLHFGSFTPPNRRSKYDLVRRGAPPPQPTAGNPTATSDEAPCHAMGYGQSGGGTHP